MGMTSVEGLIIDLDGTIYSGAAPLPFAAEWMKRVRAEGIPYLFVTNNSTRTPRQVAAHLCEIGVETDPGHVYTSSQATARYVSDRAGGKRVFCIGEEGLRQALEEAGCALIEDGEADYVVQGLDRHFTYRRLEQAVDSIRRGAAYILTNPDLLLPAEGKFVPGAGTLSAAVRAGSQTEPFVVGKPFTTIMTFALEILHLPAEAVWVVGDNPMTDIAAGRAAGCKTALILSGVIDRGQYEQSGLPSGSEADAVCDDLRQWAQRMFAKN